ncbi:MAG: carbohydrate binding family 9 domain-containing protein [Gemmatimonadetes bacterium]|nr:carbohydrate binding family 9 domain-containing protein [Gemmatimonadota bacterium]
MTHLILALWVVVGGDRSAFVPDSALGSDDLGIPRERVYDGSAGELQVETPYAVRPSIVIDGRLDKEEWAAAAMLTGFTQYDPVEGAPASQRTKVFVVRSEDALYVGVRAHDSEQGGIRATLAERDQVERSDDYIRITLDTFRDRRRAYVFMVNPLGVQQDGIWVEGGGGGEGRMMGGRPPIDYNPDLIWESQGRVEDWGYAVEIRVPLKTLRFREAPLQSWGLNVVRRIQRNGYEEAWAPITRNAANQLTQQGALTELRDLDPGLFLELNPVVTGRRVGRYESVEDRFVREDPEADFGFNLTYGLTSNLTLDAAYNPDFSQVEADAGQIAVNERFALFFPEKRPFFLEGTEVFAMPQQLVYTRSVVNPLVGGKITGKTGAYRIGYLGAVDRSAPAGSSADRAAVNVLRVRRDLGESSTLGAVYTDRTLTAREYNRVGGVDGRLVFARRYTLNVLGAASFDGTEVSGGRTGSLLFLGFGRTGRNFSVDASLEDVSSEFRAGSGFVRRVGDTQLRSRVSYNWYGRPRALVERWGPSLQFERAWDHGAFWRGAAAQEGELQLTGNVSFRNNVSVFLSLTRSFFDHGSGAYDGFYARSSDGTQRTFAPDAGLFSALDGARLNFWLNNWEAVRGRLRLEWRETPVFERTQGVPVEPADAYMVEADFNLYPTRSLSAGISLRHESLYRELDGSRYSVGTIPRVRAQYQFTRALFLRTIAEYARQERGPLRDPLSGTPLEVCDTASSCSVQGASSSNDFHVETLLTYEPSPGTVMYVGYGRDMTEPGAFRFDGLQPWQDGLFAKLSYRFRF